MGCVASPHGGEGCWAVARWVAVAPAMACSWCSSAHTITGVVEGGGGRGGRGRGRGGGRPRGRKMWDFVCVCLSLSLQAVLGAKSEIQRLQSELREVKENGAEDQRSQEANHHSMSEWQQMERELDDLRHAHQQTLAQNASLKDQLSVMQKEFEPECPAPPAPGSTPADCESQRIEKTTFSDSILSPPSSDSHTSMSGEVPSTSLPLLPAKFIQGLSSSTPDMLCGMGMRHDAKSSAVPEQSSMALGQGSMVSGQSEMELEVSVLKQLVEQLEREKENLLLGNREMSQQLTRIDASKMESASALHQILSENSLLQRELQEMREKDETGRHAREEVQSLLRAKASLSSEVANLRQALQQSSSAAALNGSLQQEVARLTEENLVGVGEEGGREEGGEGGREGGRGGRKEEGGGEGTGSK